MQKKYFIKNIITFQILYFIFVGFTPNALCAFNLFLTFTITILKSFLFYKAISNTDHDKPNKSQNTNYKSNITKAAEALSASTTEFSYGVYTILIPLYKEPKKLSSIISAINKLNYPKDKLDVKLIIEEDDEQTKIALQDYVKRNDDFVTQKYITIVYVPNSYPQTKPKALNYAINTYGYGEYVTIYDAEDIPDKNQLIDAVSEFQNLPQEYACIQAKLNFYNQNENLVSKFLYVEYKIWFEYFLSSLSKLGYPVTLGGTSNHFKSACLRELGFWNAYNVTEDAELGIKLYMHGYKTHIIDSYTLEESVVCVKSWLIQRARWIKGFTQTLMICFLQANIVNRLSIKQTTVSMLFILSASYSFYSIPWTYFLVKQSPWYIKKLWITSIVFEILHAYVTSFYILFYANKGTKKAPISILSFITWFLYPAYFMLHIIASYIAVIEMLFNPCKWNKTEHGLSKYIS